MVIENLSFRHIHGCPSIFPPEDRGSLRVETCSWQLTGEEGVFRRRDTERITAEKELFNLCHTGTFLCHFFFFFIRMKAISTVLGVI